MKALTTNRNVLIWIGMCPADENTKNWHKILFKLNGFIIFLSMAIDVMISVPFIMKFISTDLEDCLFAIFQIVLTTGTCYMVFFAYYLRMEIATIFDELQKIYDTFKNDEVFRYLAQANNKSKWSLDLFFKYTVKWFSISMILGSLCSIALCQYMHGEIIKEYLYLPHRFVLPWNQSTLWGYLAEILFVSVFTTFTYVWFNAAILTLFMAMGWHHEAFNEILQHLLHQLNHSKTYGETEMQIIRIIRFRIQIKEWFNLTAKVLSPLVLIELLDSMLTAALFVFQLDMKLKHADLEVVFLLSAIFVATGNLFLYCYFGALATDSYEKMVDSLYDVNWEDLPFKQQRYFVIMMADAQRPTYYHGFGVAVLNLGTFTQFMRAMYSYYMACKTMAN